MEEKEGDKYCFSASSEKDNLISIEVTKFKLARVDLFHITAVIKSSIFIYPG